MSRQRRIDALRALAARPGTEAEGQVAKEKLAKLEEEEVNPFRLKPYGNMFKASDFMDAFGRRASEHSGVTATSSMNFANVKSTQVKMSVNQDGSIRVDYEVEYE